MKLLITGGAGFIGSNFIDYMQKRYPNYQMISMDSLIYGSKWSKINGIDDDENLKFINADISDKDLVFDLFASERFDVVINFAAESNVDRSIENPGIFIETNIKGVQILMDACRTYNVRRFHQVSTDEVYGETPLTAHDIFFSEDSALHPRNPYAASKASADMLVSAYYETYKLPVTISRSCNNYGPQQFPDKLIPLMILNALQNKPLPIYGDGQNIRDWLYVTDHCRALDMIIHKGKAGEIYNIGHKDQRSNLDIIKIILSELNKDEDLITFVQDRVGHDLRYGIDSSKVHNEFGWHPEIGFDEGIKKTINWYKEYAKTYYEF